MDFRPEPFYISDVRILVACRSVNKFLCSLVDSRNQINFNPSYKERYHWLHINFALNAVCCILHLPFSEDTSFSHGFVPNVAQTLEDLTLDFFQSNRRYYYYYYNQTSTILGQFDFGFAKLDVLVSTAELCPQGYVHNGCLTLFSPQTLGQAVRFAN